MHRTQKQHRDEFAELGYTVFENVLTPADIAANLPVLDALITPQTMPPTVTGDANNANGRKQLNASVCEPRLAALGGHPGVLAAAATMLGPSFRLSRSPIPCVTFRSPPAGQRFDWGYHVDWPATPPRPGDETCLNGVLHLSTVETGGGAFMLIPGSHRVVTKALEDPALAERGFKQQFRDFPGLGTPKEMCVPAGSVLFYHAFLVHDRSENVLDQPRKIIFMHYRPWLEGEYESRDKAALAKSFHPDHIASMTPATRRLCGLE